MGGTVAGGGKADLSGWICAEAGGRGRCVDSSPSGPSRGLYECSSALYLASGAWLLVLKYENPSRSRHIGCGNRLACDESYAGRGQLEGTVAILHVNLEAKLGQLFN